MPRKCSVPGCRSNYNKETAYVTTYRFPKEPHRRQKWINSIHRQNFQPGNSASVCILHFHESYIIREDRATRDDGTVLVLPKNVPTLSSDAYPTIFPNQPTYLTSEPPTKRKHPEERRSDLEKRDEESFKDWLDNDKITSFHDFKCGYVSKTPCEWLSKSSDKDTGVLFFKIDESDCPKIVISFLVYESLTVDVWHNDFKLPSAKFMWILGKELKCDRWTIFESLLSHLHSYTINAVSISHKLENVSGLLHECAELLTDNDNIFDTNDINPDNILKKIVFLEQQVNLVRRKQPAYSPEMLIWASSLYFFSASSYRKIRDTGYFTLPHPNHLQRLSLQLGSNHRGLNKEHVTYLHNKFKLLSDADKTVNLLLDEIYVSPNISYKGGKLEGVSENSAPNAATTVQCFMVSSVFSKYKEVVALFPVKNMNAMELHDITLKVLGCLNSIGFRVLSLISDNNRINRNMFEKLCDGAISIKCRNPFSEKDLFLLFDTVHLLKSIRNNWINQHDKNQTFVIPSFGTQETTILNACVSDLKQLYYKEQHNVVKLAPSLSRKVLFPSTFERQNVLYAHKLFDEKNIAALSTDVAAKDTLGTKLFLELIHKWWKIVNVKNPTKGVHKRDPYCEPIRSVNDENLKFLSDFCMWLDQWDSLVISPSTRKRSWKLSSETQFSLTHTTRALCELCKHMFEEFGAKYVLLGKFQTDNLEGRFGQYRQMNGGNYHITVTQLLESEKRLKIIDLMNLSCKGGKFQIVDLSITSGQCGIDDDSGTVNLEQFGNVVSLSCDITVDENTLMALVFISGYVAHSVVRSVKCIFCSDKLVLNKELDIECVNENVNRYLKVIDRGGLKWPTELCFSLSYTAYQVFQILISEQFEVLFLGVKHHKMVLKQLIMEALEGQGHTTGETCECHCTIDQLLKKCVNVISNILMNNYSKVKNDKQPSCTKGTKRKLKTLSNVEKM